MRSQSVRKNRIILLVLTVLLIAVSAAPRDRWESSDPMDADTEKSLAAWVMVHSVLVHPRCLNCHIPGDTPLQGDEQRVHDMNVKRGFDGKGTPAMRCANCHGETNSASLHAPPGAPDWSLPQPKTPMAWKGLSSGEICRTLKDPAKNGNRTLRDLVSHMETSLVKWAWNPGPGRTVPPLAHDEFVAQLKRWIDSGAACPE